MNLFESSIADITTSENAVYLEAVNKIFNVLFEAQMPTQSSNSGLRSELCSLVQQLITDANGAKGDYLSKSIKPEKIKKLSDIVTNQNSMSDAELFQSIVGLVFGRKVVRDYDTKQAKLVQDTSLREKCISYDAYSQSVDDFLKGAAAAKVAHSAVQSYMNFKRDLLKLNKVIGEKFTPSAAPSMYTIEYTRAHKDGQYIDPKKFNVRGTINPTDNSDQSAPDSNQSANSDASAEPADTSTEITAPDVVDPTTGAVTQSGDGRVLTGTIKPTAGKGTGKGTKTAKPEPPKKPAPPPNTDFIDANVDKKRTAEDKEDVDNSQYGDIREIIMTNVDDPAGLANYLRESIETLLQTRGKLLGTTLGIKIESMPEDNTVIIMSDLEGSNMNAQNIQMVAMYCLYMDAKKEGLVNRNDTTITYPVAYSLSNDYYNNNGALLNKLSNMYDTNAIMIVNKPTMNDLTQYMYKFGDDVDHEALAAALSQVIKNYSSSDLTKYTDLRDAANKEAQQNAAEQQIEGEDQSESTTDNSQSPAQDALQRQTDAFCDQVAHVYQAMQDQKNGGMVYEDDDLGGFMDESYEDHYSAALDELKNNKAYDYVMTFMLGHIGQTDQQIIKPRNAGDELDEESKAKNNAKSSYNQQAAQLLTYCRNDIRNKEAAENQMANVSSSDDYDDAFASALDNIDQDNPFASDIINSWNNAR